jgi:hypothetical protein
MTIFDNLRKDFIKQIIKQKSNNINNNYCKRILRFLHFISHTNISSKQKAIVNMLLTNYNINLQKLPEEQIFQVNNQ